MDGLWPALSCEKQNIINNRRYNNLSGRVRQRTRNLYNLTQCALMIMGAWYLPAGHGDSRSHRCTISDFLPQTTYKRDTRCRENSWSSYIAAGISIYFFVISVWVGVVVLFRCGTRLAWTTLRFLIFLARWAVWALLLHQQKFSNGENTETSSRFTYLDQGFDPITAQPLGVETRNPWVRGVRYSRFFIEFQSFRVSSVQSTRFVTTYLWSYSVHNEFVKILYFRLHYTLLQKEHLKSLYFKGSILLFLFATTHSCVAFTTPRLQVYV